MAGLERAHNWGSNNRITPQPRERDPIQHAALIPGQVLPPAEQQPLLPSDDIASSALGGRTLPAKTHVRSSKAPAGEQNSRFADLKLVNGCILNYAGTLEMEIPAARIRPEASG